MVRRRAIMEQRLSLVTLGVGDLERSRKFYATLGWQEGEPSKADVAFYQLPGLALALYGRKALAEDARLSSRGSGFGGITLAYNVRVKADANRVLRVAMKAGGRLLKPAQATFWGGYSGYFADPDGHPWEVAWNPFFPIARDGSLSLTRSPSRRQRRSSAT